VSLCVVRLRKIPDSRTLSGAKFKAGGSCSHLIDSSRLFDIVSENKLGIILANSSFNKCFCR
jgi:hypothetical protein